ncbi:MAG: DUF2202 domain-containing protein [Campylobacterota bacterium]|nr:DUF2202 domain-containing protein [Campylobacterota bacterium]
MKTHTLTASIFTALLLVGCGSDSNAPERYGQETSDITPTDITVERGPVLNALVVDAKGQKGQSQGKGVYRFYAPEYPVKSYGGYIDINRNGVVDNGDVSMQQLQLMTGEGHVMTMATTMAQNGELYSYMKEFGLSEDEVLRKTPTMDKDIAALSDEMYKYCVKNNISEPIKLQGRDMDRVHNRLNDRRNTYKASNMSAAEHEYMLINEEMNVQTLNEEQVEELVETGTQTANETIINTLGLSDLSDEQKHTLAYMWNEEKLAKDIYLNLNALTPSQTLYNIATKAETRHQASIESLIEKYDLNILNETDYSGGYDADNLTAYSSGAYSIEVLNTLYDTLYAKGSQSLQDALEVGCMVEVTDINDLLRDIEIAEGAPDLVIVFQSLLSGSYSHYWAFNNALQNRGVNEGCCVLGDDFCKTSEEYPQPINGNQSENTGNGNSQNGNQSGNRGNGGSQNGKQGGRQ